MKDSPKAIPSVSIALFYVDIPFSLETFTKLGCPLSIHLALTQTQILTSTTCKFHLPYLTPKIVSPFNLPSYLFHLIPIKNVQKSLLVPIS
jgi:hypothetical protein